MGSPVSPVIANIYMKYLEELALGPQFFHTHILWKRYVDDIICITKKVHVNILFDYINQIDDHIKFTMEHPDKEGSLPFLDNKCTHPNQSIQTSVYRKFTHTDKYLDWNTYHPISAKRSVVQALIHRAKIVNCTPELLAKEIDYLNKVLCLNSYPDWFLKYPTATNMQNQTSRQEASKEAFVSAPYIQGLSEKFRRIFKNTKVQIIFKGCITVKTLLMQPKDKIPAQLYQDIVYQCTCSTENCSSTYIGESSRCLESRVKEHSTSSTGAIFQHSTTCNHPKADISQFKILDQDRKQVSREAREAIHIRRNNPAL